VATPFILMRHWDEWQKSKTFEIDDKDRELCSLVMEIQHECQRYYFGKQAQMYFENEERDAENRRRRTSKYDSCYEQLPQKFSVENLADVYGIAKLAAHKVCSRLTVGGFIVRTKKGEFIKLKTTLI
jgi:hypothetical protein